MDRKTEGSLLRLAQETARAIRKRTHISGWHEDGSWFPAADFTDVLGMLEKAYSLGKKETERTAEKRDKIIRDLLNDLVDWMECGFISEKTFYEEVTGCVPMEVLDEFGFGDQVRKMDEDGVLDEDEE